MNKQKELAKNTLIITIGKICTQFLSFFLMPLYTTVLTTSEYGTVDLFLTYTSLFLPVILLQMDQAIFRFLIDYRSNESGKKKVITTAYIFTIIQVIIGAIIFIIAQIYIHSKYEWYFLASVIASITSCVLLQVARGMGKTITYAIGSFISASVQIVCNIIFLVIFKWRVEGMLMATILGNISCALFIFINTKVYRYISIKYFSKSKLKQMLKYSLPLVPNSICWWIINVSDRTIVLMFLGTSSNGLISVGHKFSSIYATIYNLFNLSWSESASLHINDKDKNEFFSSVISNMFKFFMCIAICLISAMPFIYNILVNKQYTDAYNLVPIFIVASMFNVVQGLYSVVYVALKKTKEIAKTSIFAGIINVGVHLLLVKQIGVYAAPISSVIAFASMSIYRYFDIKRYIDVRLKKSTILLTFLLCVISVTIYVSKIVIIQFIWLIIVSILTFILNYEMIKPILNKFKTKIKG